MGPERELLAWDSFRILGVPGLSGDCRSWRFGRRRLGAVSGDGWGIGP